MLTKLEQRILAALEDGPMMPKLLVYTLWPGRDMETGVNSLRVAISKLRKKGYKIENDDSGYKKGGGSSEQPNREEVSPDAR